MEQYKNLVENIMAFGVDKEDRTGTGTRSIFGYQMRFDLNEGFPLLTTKKVFLRGIIHELLWFISGSTNIKYLVDNNVHIWDDWAYRDYVANEEKSFKVFIDKAGPTSLISAKNILNMSEFINKIKEEDENSDFVKTFGNLGPVYGKQWRNFNGTDQLTKLIKNLKNNPDSRRHIISAWNPSEVDEMALPPCHSFMQFYVVNNKLSCQLYQRSGDVFLGIPFNIASYSLFTMMIAQVCGLELGEFIHTIGDAHIYKNHFEQVELQLSRETRELPTMKINPDVKSIFDFKIEDFTLENYNPHPSIKGKVAV